MKILYTESRQTKVTFTLTGASKATDKAIVRKCNFDKRAKGAEVVRLNNGLVECTLAYLGA